LTLIKIFDVIPAINNNYTTVIPNIASLILDSGSLIDTIYYSFCNDKNIKLFNYFEKEHCFSQIKSVFLEKPLRLFSPFYNCFSDNNEFNQPKWWSAYNGIKHSRLDNIDLCNLENCLNILCALHQIIAQEKIFFKALVVNNFIKTNYNIEFVTNRLDYVYAKERSEKAKEIVIETNLFYSELGKSNNQKTVNDFGSVIIKDTKLRIRQICENESGNLF
jgi:hypothetical protein